MDETPLTDPTVLAPRTTGDVPADAAALAAVATARRRALRSMTAAGLASLAGSVALVCGVRALVTPARIGLGLLLLGGLRLAPLGLAALRGAPSTHDGNDPEATARAAAPVEMVQSLAFSYALVLCWMAMAATGPLRLLVGDVVTQRKPWLAAFVGEFGVAVLVGSMGLFFLGWALGEVGRSRQAMPRMGSALALGLLYFAHTRAMDVRLAAGEHASVEGYVLFPGAALAFIQLYAGTDKFAADGEGRSLAGLERALAIGPVTAWLVTLVIHADLSAGTVAGDPVACMLAGLGAIVAPLWIGCLSLSLPLRGHRLLDLDLYRGLMGLALLTALLALSCPPP